MCKPYALRVAHTVYGQAVCATCSAYSLWSSLMRYVYRIWLMVKPYALRVVHTAYGQAIYATCIRLDHMLYALRVALKAWGQAICTTCSA